MLSKQESRRIRVDIRHILLRDWDPIGVSQDPNAVSEYDGYIGRVYLFLTEGGSDQEIKEYLRWVVKERMELNPNEGAIAATVSSLRKIVIQ